MRKLIVLLALICAGCSFQDTIEYDVEYSVSSAVPCEITYLDEHSEWVTVTNVTDYSIVIHKVFYYVDSSWVTPEYVIKERCCQGTIGIKINGQGVTKTIGVSCCCEEVLKYSAMLK